MEGGQIASSQRFQEITDESPHKTFIRTKANTLRAGLKYKFIFTDFSETKMRISGDE